MDVDANALVILGLCLDLVGAALFSVDALAASEFIARIDAGEGAARGSEEWLDARLAQNSFNAATNTVLVYLLFTGLSFVAVLWFLPGHPLALALLVAPFVYFAWKIVTWVAERIQSLLGRVRPYTGKEQIQSALGCLVYTIFLVPWLVLYFTTAVTAIALRFGFDIPLRFFSERRIGPWILKALRRSARMQERDRFFRGNAFRGLVFLLAGFSYQLIGSVLQLLGH